MFTERPVLSAATPSGEAAAPPLYMTVPAIVAAARARLADADWDAVAGGSESETTLRRNRLALDSLAFRPRVLRDVSRVDASAVLFGQPSRLPLFLAPVGRLERLDPEGSIAAARAAATLGVPYFQSSQSDTGLEDAAAAAPAGTKIYQLYIAGDDGWLDSVIERAIGSGYHAVAITVDTPVFGRRERTLALEATQARRKHFADNPYRPRLTWETIRRLRERHAFPLVIKGISTAEDAAIACEIGVDVIYVSNHGGRQLDHSRAAIDILPEVAAAVHGRAQVVVDGGFTRGTDVLKALALGADAVGIGKLFCYGLAAAGEAGVIRVLELIESEILNAMALLGVTRLPELGESYLHPAPPAEPVDAAFRR